MAHIKPIVKLSLGLNGWTTKHVLVHMPGRDTDTEHVDHCDLDADFTQAIVHLRNPQIDDDEQALDGGLQILYSRLLDQGFHLYPVRQTPVVSRTISRVQISKICGGNPICTFPKTNSEKARGYTRLMCLNLLYNAHAPQHPGAPGLYYALKDQEWWPKEEESVFVRYGQNRWNYVGRYSCQKSEAVPPEEFLSLDKTVQNIWIENTLSHSWGRFTLASIYLRKSNRKEPDNEAIQSLSKRSAFLRGQVSRDDVEHAFATGEEKLNCWILRCVGYDAKFKRYLITQARKLENVGSGYWLRSSVKKSSGVGKRTSRAHGKRR